MISSEAIQYNKQTGEIKVITKNEFCSFIKNTFPIQPSLYINKTYKEIVKNLGRALKEFAPKMYSFVNNKNNVIICLLGKTKEDFEKYCKKNNMKLQNTQEVTKVYKKETPFELITKVKAYIDNNYKLCKSGSCFDVSYYAPGNRDEEVIELYGPGKIAGTGSNEIVMYIYGSGDSYKSSAKMIEEIRKDKDLAKYLRIK